MSRFWTEAKLAEFLMDLSIIKIKNVSRQEIYVDQLAQKMPASVQSYYEKTGKEAYKDIRKIPCVLQCPRCNTKIESQWLSLTAAKEKNRLNTLTPVEVCPTCESQKKFELVSGLLGKWEIFLSGYNAWVEKQTDKKFINFLNFLDFSKIFQGKLDFLKYRWQIKNDFNSLVPLLQHDLLCDVSLSHEGALSFSFVPLEPVPLTAKEHDFLLNKWAISYFFEVGQRVCRWKNDFKLSEKSFYEIRLLIKRVSVFELSYSLFYAEKEAIALAEIKKFPRRETFLNSFKTALENFVQTNWKISEKSKVQAKRSLPDTFWQLISLRSHDYTVDAILATPLGKIAWLLSSSGSEETLS